MTGYRGRIARSLVNARESADVSQRELAERLGRDKRTVQKWESGEMKISMEDFLEIFDALHVAVEPYSKWIRHPELFPNGLADINKFNHDKRRSALVHYYGRQASPVEVEQEYYILFADHGSDYYGMRQQRIANLQTPLRDRRRICGQIIGNYYEARELGAPTRMGRSPTWTSCWPVTAPVPKVSGTAATAMPLTGPCWAWTTSHRPTLPQTWRSPSGNSRAAPA